MNTEKFIAFMSLGIIGFFIAFIAIAILIFRKKGKVVLVFFAAMYLLWYMGFILNGFLALYFKRFMGS